MPAEQWRKQSQDLDVQLAQLHLERLDRTLCLRKHIHAWIGREKSEVRSQWSEVSHAQACGDVRVGQLWCLHHRNTDMPSSPIIHPVPVLGLACLEESNPFSMPRSDPKPASPKSKSAVGPTSNDSATAKERFDIKMRRDQQ